MINGYYAESHETTKQFIEELKAVFEKHQLAIVPTYEGEVSFHDKLTVVPYDADTARFFARTDILIEEPDEPEE